MSCTAEQGFSRQIPDFAVHCSEHPSSYMSQVLIQQYLNQLRDLRKVSGTHRESVVREAFKDLLKGYARSHDLVFVPEYEIETPSKDRRYVDGALLHTLRMPFGHWEAKDEKDDLDAEIATKLRRGYPQDNIIFEDSTKAVLVQEKQEVYRCPVDDVKALEKLLNLFFRYERPEIAEFRKAVEQYKADLPAVIGALRDMIDKAFSENTAFQTAAERFLKHAQETINPTVMDADVREMLIQHILTEEIFAKVFGEDDFHRQNNVAKELYALEGTFFTGDLKKRTLRGLDSYYAAIRSAAAQISSHHEKQTFLKVIYENFYKVYNRKAADRLGVVYTPNEIVRFMVESADWLCEKHFRRNLIDKDVEILDPAVGTGTFICEMLEHFRGQPAKLKHKYLEELHANEVAILPYYVANLNIEATYAAITSEYLEYPNLCFVDTLDNTYALRKHSGHMGDLFGAVSAENVGRIRRQNSRRISVIIGNPPYNANQLNENENNRNREYREIDKRIKDTYVQCSGAQKTKLYDMYARFLRWAADRLDENGILAFITNRGFIDKRTYDGFRKVVAREFNEIYIIDLGGDVRDNPKLSGTKHNVFGIQTGVAISLMVRRAKQSSCRIYYSRRPEFETADEKLAFLNSSEIRAISFDEILPDEKGNWLNQAHTDFDSLVPLATKQTKAAKKQSDERAIFRLFSLGASSNRDDWAVDMSKAYLEKKVEYFFKRFREETARWVKHTNTKSYSGQAERLKALANFVSRDIKWTSELEAHLDKGTVVIFNPLRVREYLYRPFIKLWTYYEPIFTHRLYQQGAIFPVEGIPENMYICFMGDATDKPFSVLAGKTLPDLNLLSAAAAGTKVIPFWRYQRGSGRVENITDWARDEFKQHYAGSVSRQKDNQITKESIFNYVYGVLHDPVYREKYSLNLKREFPRIPFYKDFWQWAEWGKELMDLHINYESVAPFKLKRIDAPDKGSRRAGVASKSFLKADKQGGRILIDSETTLTGVPPEAWEYRLGNRSALEWILDQYKEKKPKDPTIREKFNTYRFAEYKEKVIDLIGRVTTVSIRTVGIVRSMKDTYR
jgi:predicted helicase